MRVQQTTTTQASYNMGYLDPPDYDEFLGCPCCGAGEEQIDENEDDELICSVCHTNVNEAYTANKDLWTALPENYFYRTCTHCKQQFFWGNLDQIRGLHDELYVTCKAHRPIIEAKIKQDAALEEEYHKQAELLREEIERDRCIALGWLDPVTGEMTDDYYRASQLAYEQSRGK